MTKPEPVRYRTTNWKSYNDALRRRGSLLIWLDKITRERVSTPLVKLSCEFLAPSRIGDTIRMSLSVKSVGRTSVTLQIDGSRGEEARVRAELVAVNASLETLRPVPFSDEVRTRMQRFKA